MNQTTYTLFVTLFSLTLASVEARGRGTRQGSTGNYAAISLACVLGICIVIAVIVVIVRALQRCCRRGHKEDVTQADSCEVDSCGMDLSDDPATVEEETVVDV